jgi:hypothetical protein
MEISDTDSEFEVECTKKLMKIFSHQESLDIATTLLGAADHMAKHMTKGENVEEFLRLPTSVQYGILQFVQWYKTIGGIIRNEITCKQDLKLGYLRCGGISWKTDEDFQQRIDLLVKSIYEKMQ